MSLILICIFLIGVLMIVKSMDDFISITSKTRTIVGILITICIPTYFAYTYGSHNVSIQEYVNTDANADTCYIPYQMSTGVYMINAKIYDMQVQCMFDTGCGFPLVISESMYEKLSESYDMEDLQYYGHTSTAGGNVDTWYFTLPAITINGITFYDVICGVSQNIQVPLVGGTLFSSYKSVNIDSEKSKIILVQN